MSSVHSFRSCGCRCGIDVRNPNANIYVLRRGSLRDNSIGSKCYLGLW